MIAISWLPAGITWEFLALIGIVLVLAVVFAILLRQQKRRTDELEKRLRKLMRGKDAASLESEIDQLFSANDMLLRDAQVVREQQERQQFQLDTSIRRIGIIRYDAFSQMGGKLSFALAMLNDESDGLILNSVHSQDGNYIYIREVRTGKCEQELGKEEQQALDKAIAQD